MRRSVLDSVVVVTIAAVVGLSTETNRLYAGIYWTEYGTIYRANLDGSQKSLVFPASSTNGYACGLAIDAANQKLYTYGRSNPTTVDSGYGFVRRMNLDGSNSEVLISSGLGTITYGFALDVANNKMYMGQHGQLKQANMDGTDLHDLPLKLYYPGDLDVDNLRLYFNESLSFDGVGRADLAGLAFEQVYHGPASSFALDSPANQLYISGGVTHVGGESIKRVNLDGSGLTTLVSGLTFTNSLEVNIPDGKMYWMTNAEIQRANLDGSGVERVVLLGGSGPLGKEDMILGPVPEPSSLALLGLAVISLLAYAWHRRIGICSTRAWFVLACVVLPAEQAWAVAFPPGLYVTRCADRGTGNAVLRVDPNGNYSTVISFPDRVCPLGLAFYDENRLGVTFGAGGVFQGTYKILDSQGTALASYSPIPQTNNPGNGAWGVGIAIDTDGTAYIATHNTPGATRITSTGQVSDWTGYNYGLWWGKDAAIAPDGDLYMGHYLYAGTGDGSIHEINKTSGVSTCILSNIDSPAGLAFDAAGDMYFSQQALDQLWVLRDGTTQPSLLANLPAPCTMTMGPDDYLYAIGRQSDTRYQIWKVDTITGVSTLYADNLPPLVDIAFAPVPEPSSFVLLGLGAICLMANLWRRRGGLSASRIADNLLTRRVGGPHSPPGLYDGPA